MRVLSVVMLVTFVGLQLRLWAGDGSLAEVWRLQRAIEAQQAEIDGLAERNARMLAQVHDLKSGLTTVEALARRELGLIGPAETFFLVIDEPPPRQR